MKRNNNGLEPHKESKIKLTVIDKIIFALGVSGYGISVILEEKFKKNSEISSTIAISATGTFLVLRAFQNVYAGKVISRKDKLLFLAMLVGGFALNIIALFPIVKYIIK